MKRMMPTGLLNQLNEEGQEKIEEYVEMLLATGNYRKNMTRLEWARKKQQEKKIGGRNGEL